MDRYIRWLATFPLAFLLACPLDEGEVDDTGVEDLTIVVEADKSRILEEEESLKAKRETVEAEKQRLARERNDIAKQIASLSKKDRKQRSKLEAEEKRLASEEKKLLNRVRDVESERNKLANEKTELLNRISQMRRGGGGALTIEQREDNVAKREDAVAKREAELDKKRKEINDTLKKATELLASLQGGSGRTVYVNTSTSGAPRMNATKAQVQKTQRTVKKHMEDNGILPADLPHNTRPLNDTIKRAIAAKDYNTAMQAVKELDTIVVNMKIDYRFVQGKFERIDRSYKGQVEKLDEKRKKKVLTLLDDVSDSFSDGRYDRANRKINEIYLLLEKK